ncbi:MAG: DUF6174 domain-containing protein [Gemmatimonadaceae bacterium]
MRPGCAVMRTIRFAAIALLGAASCTDAVSPTHRPTDLEAARQQWQAQNLHTYAFTLQRSCFCGNLHPLYVAVLSDTVAGVIDLETTETVDRSLGETVDDLFAFIQTAIDRPAKLIRANYDTERGYPTEIDYDGSAQIADDEIFYRVSDVHPISPQRASVH